MSSNKVLFKKLYALTITESNGVSTELKNGFIEHMKEQPYHLLTEEGGKGSKHHYHLHAVVGSNYSTSSNYRKKTMKSLYTKLGKTESFTTVGLRIKTITEESKVGALSYCMKDAQVLTSSGVDLDGIKPWREIDTQTYSKRVEQMKSITSSNFVSEVCLYIDKNTILHPDGLNSVRNIIQQMMGDGYLFTFDNRTKNNVGRILQCYQSTHYSMDLFDQLTLPQNRI